MPNRSQQHKIERDGYDSQYRAAPEFTIGWIGAGPLSEEVTVTVGGGPATASDINVVSLRLRDANAGVWLDVSYSAQEDDTATDVAAALAALIDAYEAFDASNVAGVITITLQAVPTSFTAASSLPEFRAVSVPGPEFTAVAAGFGDPSGTITVNPVLAAASGNDRTRITATILTDAPEAVPLVFSYDALDTEDEDDVAAGLAAVIDVEATLDASSVTANEITVDAAGAATNVVSCDVVTTWIGIEAEATVILITVIGGPATDDDLTVLEADLEADGGGIDNLTYSVQNAESASAAATGLAAAIDGGSYTATADGPVVTVVRSGITAITQNVVFPQMLATLTGAPGATLTLTVLGVTATEDSRTVVSADIEVDSGTPENHSHDVQTGETINDVAASMAAAITQQERVSTSVLNNVVTITFEPTGTGITQAIGAVQRINP
jgi:hypothetical protein